LPLVLLIGAVFTKRSQLEPKNKLASFEAAILPHLSSAYNYARFLLQNESDAEDVVQESYLRAFKYFHGYHGGDSRAWLLTIVRNTSYNLLQQNRSRQLVDSIDDSTEVLDTSEYSNPETVLRQRIDKDLLKQAIEELPINFREVLILREMEELSYKEIGTLCDLPIGTVMSRLARARARLQEKLAGKINQEI
jgi:RNA polymerase sigma-70 factor (ECF subfamily)